MDTLANRCDYHGISKGTDSGNNNAQPIAEIAQGTDTGICNHKAKLVAVLAQTVVTMSNC